jgi:hypothetical protein
MTDRVDVANLGLVPNPTEVVEQTMGRQLRGLLIGSVYGIGLALVLGLIWYGLEVFGNVRFLMLIVIFGVAIGYPIGATSKAAPAIAAFVSLLVTAACVAVLLYFLDRHAFVEVISDAKFPLWTGWDTARLMVETGFKADKLRYLLVPVTIIFGGTAGWVAARDERKALSAKAVTATVA